MPAPAKMHHQPPPPLYHPSQVPTVPTPRLHLSNQFKVQLRQPLKSRAHPLARSRRLVIHCLVSLPAPAAIVNPAAHPLRLCLVAVLRCGRRATFWR
jgi:predicted lipid carrier protein YhbT